MVAGPNSNAFLVKQPADFLRAMIGENEADDAHFFPRSPNNSQTVDFGQPFGRVLQQLVLIGSDVWQPDAIDVIERRTEAHGISNVRRSCLESRRRFSIRR